MLMKVLQSKADDVSMMTPTEKGLVYSPVENGKADQREIELCFARLFASEDGQRALGYLQMLTFQRALGPDSLDEQLRYAEGQRSLMAMILRLIARGRQPG